VEWRDYLKAIGCRNREAELQLIRDHICGLVEREYNRKVKAPEWAKQERTEEWR
jgi:hypothetical protein